jgi:gamma-glutamylcyclotransferase (GGCT)/AIG2-like uncharacterized protein YtfP
LPGLLAVEMMDLFAYGTLMCADIMRAVSGCTDLASSAGLLRDHSRLCVRGEHYPGLVPRPGASVEGIVYHAVPADAWARLDRFEGDMYVRACVDVELDDATIHRAQTYLVRPGLSSLLEDRVWKLEDFLRHGKADFENAYAGYAAIDTTPGVS